ncbi:organic cation transporter protein-like isoform X2 [Mizuhopecten yessoensis]|uniref:organic cation transporter protein-like isoform X2 n=1 Tax=Mizuhopecten yessoensis TaxID=6573 RepID=UPI000B45A393|nr:organic cation transporter protein-like isoform X2 [Mizuhopecten yessoensis]
MYSCQIPEVPINSTHDLSTLQYVNSSRDVSILFGNHSNGSHNQEALQCHISSCNETSNMTSQTKCTKWEYSTDEMSKTPISDFDLVCDNVVLRSHASMVFFGGTLVGVILAGMLGDVVGRKPVMVIGVFTLTISSMACVWSYNYQMFLVTRFLTGLSSLMVFAPCMLIPMEMVGPTKRVFVGIIIELLWCIGEVVLCGLAYFIRDWRTLQLVLAIPCVLLLAYTVIIPESPRWLLLVGRRKQAMQILRKIAKVNGTTLTGEITEVCRESGSLRDILTLLKKPKLVLRWTIVSFIWFAISLSYYGLILNAGRIGGNIYLNFLVSAIVEALGYSSCLVINDRFGRKIMNCGSLVLTGVACLSTILTTQLGGESLSWFTITLSMIGKFGVSAAFGNIFIYTSELFPTSSRSFILSSSNIFARIGSLISPYIADLSLLVDSMFGKALPLIIFGCLGLSAGLVSLVLPETLNATLPDTINDILSADDKDSKRTWKHYHNDQDNDAMLGMPLRSSS